MIVKYLLRGIELVAVRTYWYLHCQKVEIEKKISELIESGVIWPSKNPFSFPVLLVKKKERSWRMCADCTALNKVTIKDKFPISNTDELPDELCGASFFSKLDLRSRYLQIRMHEHDIYKTTFGTHHVHYEILAMPLGLSNAPTFQSFMDTIFQNLLRKIVLVFFLWYIDLQSKLGWPFVSFRRGVCCFAATSVES